RLADGWVEPGLLWATPVRFVAVVPDRLPDSPEHTLAWRARTGATIVYGAGWRTLRQATSRPRCRGLVLVVKAVARGPSSRWLEESDPLVLAKSVGAESASLARSYTVSAMGPR